jgi:hypothetical protein
MTGYHLLDYFFLVFHLAIVIFNIFGWIWKRTRVANLILLILTGGSWFILGLFYGFGYCPFTDWHWQVLAILGKMPDETSYMQYFMARLFGLHFSSQLADSYTLIAYLLALMLSTIFNIKQWRRKLSEGR